MIRLTASAALSVILLSASVPAFANDGVQASISNEAIVPQAKDAVMIIRFNQKYIYFENAMKKVIDRVASVKPGAIYEIQSIIPNDGSDANAKKYLENLRNVVGTFNKLGIGTDKLSIRTDVANVENQEVNIFVR